MNLNPPTFVRQIAVKTNIRFLLNSQYIQEDENNPNYLQGSVGEKIYRLNLIAVVVQKEQIGTMTNLLLDDGTGRIILRSFEENKSISFLQPGHTVLVIGKLRSYNQERYISGEIVKNLDCSWLKLRSMELDHENNQKESFSASKNMLNSIVNPHEKEEENKKNDDHNTVVDKIGHQALNTPSQLFKEEIIFDLKELPENKAENINEDNEMLVEDSLVPAQKIINMIKEMDKGEGVLIEEIIEKSLLQDTEKIIDRMLENGDIFQNSPGRVKVL